jgi:hypothetical protein
MVVGVIKSIVLSDMDEVLESDQRIFIVAFSTK